MKNLILIIVFIISGCATTYGPNGMTGGYKEEMVDDSSYIVSFFGNGYTSEQEVWNFWIYRCAELTVEKGYKLFSLKPSDKHALRYNQDQYQLVEFSMPNDKSNMGLIPAQFYYYSVTTYSSKALVNMYNPPIASNINSMQLLDAEYILEQLKPYIDSNAKAASPNRKLLLIRSAVEAAIKAKMLNEKEAERLRRISI
ncbi:CC0125/CC1285 family lipoprotein [Thalassotalea montiporae]